MDVFVWVTMVTIVCLIFLWRHPGQKAQKIAECICGIGGRLPMTHEEEWLACQGMRYLSESAQMEMLARWEDRDPRLLLLGMKSCTLDVQTVHQYGRMRSLYSTAGTRREWLEVIWFVHGSVAPSWLLERLYRREMHIDKPVPLEADEIEFLMSQPKDTLRGLKAVFIALQWYEYLAHPKFKEAFEHVPTQG